MFFTLAIDTASCLISTLAGGDGSRSRDESGQHAAGGRWRWQWRRRSSDAAPVKIAAVAADAMGTMIIASNKAIDGMKWRSFLLFESRNVLIPTWISTEKFFYKHIKCFTPRYSYI